jgi:hypothetical protein
MLEFAEQRGIAITRMTASTMVEAGSADWRAVCKAVGAAILPQDPGWRATFSALPDPRKGHYLTGDVHDSEEEDGKKVHWHFEIYEIPEASPPKHVIASSESVGGYPGVLTRISEQWPKNPAAFDVTVGYTLPTSRWRSVLGAHGFQSLKFAGDQTATPTMVGWSLQPPSGPVIWIAESRDSSEVLGLVVRAACILEIRGDFIAELESEIWKGVKGLLVEREAGGHGDT